MSASTQKKTRAAEMEAGTYKKQTAQRERDEKKAKDRRTMILCVTAVVVIVLAAILLNLIPDMQAKKELRQYSDGVAVTIGDRSYSPAEISYLYANQFSTLANNMYAIYFYGLDTSKGASGLGSQAYLGPQEEGKTLNTWRDYILDSVYTQLKQTQVLLNYAKANGITLDETELQDIENDVGTYKAYASTYGYPSVDQFLSANLGKGLTLDMIRTLEQESALAQKAYNAYQNSLSFSDEEIKAEYASFNGDQDTYSYAYYEASVSEPSGEGESAVPGKTAEECEAEIDAVIASYKDGGDVEDLYERFNGYIEAELGSSANRSTDNSGSYLPELYADWLKDEARKPGDVEKFVDEDGCCLAVLFLDHTDMNYATANVRHILVKAVAGEDGTYSDEAKAAAKASAEEILETYLAGTHTEAAFAALAEQYSEDGGSNTNGGLYENVYKGQMVTEFNDFLFAEGRQVGDTGIVYGESSSYAGYHVMYYVGEGRLYSDILGENSLISKALTEFLADPSVTITVGANEGLVDPVTEAVETAAEG